MINRMRYWLRRFDYKNRFKEMCLKDNKIIIFGTPLHRNLGDQLIAVSTKKFLTGFFDEDLIYEVPEEFYRIYIDGLEECIKDTDTIIISGGGFVGNVWLGWLWLEDIIERFKNNKIIIFPQSVFFDNRKENYIMSIAKCKNILEGHNNIILYVRERYSFDFVLKHFPKLDVRLVPDIALAYDVSSINKSKYRERACFCLRDDCELHRDDSNVVMIKDFLKKMKCDIIYSDTGSKSRVYEFYREHFVINKIKEYAKYQLIVTDRLHGMIFAFLAGTPCIIFDNNSRKVYGVYNEWLCKSKLIMPFESVSDINIIKMYIKKAISNNIKDDFKIDINLFDDLQKAIVSK